MSVGRLACQAARNTAAVGAVDNAVAVVLGEVERVEAARLRALQRGDPLLVNLLDRLVALGLDVVEDPELDTHDAVRSFLS